MGAAISSTVMMGVGYCCVNIVGGLCNACFGSTAVGTTGRKRSILLFSMAILLALWFQHHVGPAIVSQKGWLWTFATYVPGLGKLVYHNWYDDCHDDGLEIASCAGNAGVFRVMSLATLFFLCMAAASKADPELNRRSWPSKYGAFTIAVLLSIFLPSSPFFSAIYLWYARFVAIFFVLFQQVILIDLAYNWNENWVERADHADRVIYGSGKYWLRAIVGTCFTFYTFSLVWIILMFKYFDGCAGNIWVLTLTLFLICILTFVQLSGSEGSLLTSSIMSFYLVYLAHCIVSKNPHSKCNPELAGNDAMGVIMGLTFTCVSLAWTGWSWTAEERLASADSVQSTRPVVGSGTGSNPGSTSLEVPFLDPGEAPTSGVVMDSSATNNSDVVHTEIWKLNIVLSMISCWVSMVLTGWGTLLNNAEAGSSGHVANPTIGRFNMVMLGFSQWLTVGLYLWTLVAPTLFPDRDFT